MLISPEEFELAADNLRALALDERLKAQVMATPALARIAQRISQRYLAGDSIDSAFAQVAQITARGHRSSIECVGESIRDRHVAEAETGIFLRIAERLKRSKTDTTLSFDLSHLGSAIDPELGLRNALRVARAAREAGTYLMISAEGSDRTDLVLELWEKLICDFPETGITLQARLSRTSQDLVRVLELQAGPVRLVKGAFQEPLETAMARNDPGLADRYAQLAGALISSGRQTNIATHDARLIRRLKEEHGAALLSPQVEFEMLQGLGTQQLDALREEGFTTREYAVFGPEYWLYVLNRLAEEPQRIMLAVADLQRTHNAAQGSGMNAN